MVRSFLSVDCFFKAAALGFDLIGVIREHRLQLRNQRRSSGPG
jgi:hypothetical protein